MPSTYSDLLRLEIQAPGENDDTWGDKINVVFQLLENAISKRQAVTLAASDVTLTTNNGADDQARSLCLALDGSLTANVNVIVPSKSKLYVVTNDTTGAFTVTIKTSAGTGVVIAQGERALVYCDGTNVVGVTPAVASLVTALTGTFALLGAAQSFTKAQAATVVTLTDAATVAVDASLSNKFRLVLGGNRTLGNPTGVLNGQDFSILVVQDGTGSRTLAYASNYRWPGGTAPTLTTTAGRADLLTFTYDSVSGTYLGSIIQNYAI